MFEKKLTSGRTATKKLTGGHLRRLMAMEEGNELAQFMDVIGTVQLDGQESKLEELELEDLAEVFRGITAHIQDQLSLEKKSN